MIISFSDIFLASLNNLECSAFWIGTCKLLEFKQIPLSCLRASEKAILSLSVRKIVYLINKTI